MESKLKNSLGVKKIKQNLLLLRLILRLFCYFYLLIYPFYRLTKSNSLKLKADKKNTKQTLWFKEWS